MKACSKCGKEMPDENGFCDSCGEKMEGDSSAAAGTETAAGTEEETGVKAEAEATSEVKAGAEAEPEAEPEVKAESEVTTEAKAEPETKAEAEAASEVTAEADAASEAEAEAGGDTTSAAADTDSGNAQAATEKANEETKEVAQMSGAGMDSFSAGEKKPGGGKKVGIIAGVIALAAVAGVAGMVMTRSTPKDPKEAVIDAFKSVYQEERVDHLDDIFGFAEMSEHALTQNSEAEITLKFDGSSFADADMFNGSAMEILTKSDMENKKMSMLFGVQYQGMDLAHADIYVDEKEVIASVPELSTKAFALNYADDLQGQIENSPMLGAYIAEAGLDLNVFSEYMDYAYSLQSTEEDRPFNFKALWERYKTGSQAIENLKTAMTVEKGEKATKKVDGKDANCMAYNATISGPAMVDFFRTSSDFFLTDETLKADVLEYLTQIVQLSKGMDPYSYSTYQDPEEMRDEAWEMAETSVDDMIEALAETLQSDINMVVYVDDKGRLAALEAKTELTIDEDTVNAELNVAMKGGDYLSQNYDIELSLFDDESELTFTVNQTESFDGDLFSYNLKAAMNLDGDIYDFDYVGTFTKGTGAYDIALVLNADADKLSFTMDGVVSEIEKGKKMVATADSMKFEGFNQYLDFSGSYAYRPLEGEVTIPEGEKFDMLAATEDDWNTVGMEMFMNIMQLSTKLQ